MSGRFPQILPISVTQAMIDEAECRDPNHCMIKLAVKQAIGGHGYVKVDSTGVSITRRPDYREKAFLPNPVKRAMVLFDRDKTLVRPFRCKLKFFKTTKITKVSEERQKQISTAKRRRRAEGRPDNPGTMMQKRIVGLAIDADLAGIP